MIYELRFYFDSKILIRKLQIINFSGGAHPLRARDHELFHPQLRF
jgi:hypothetical protein